MGCYFVFKVNQTLIRSDIRAIISSGYHREMFILLKIDNPASNRNFKKMDHNEFSYCGRLYDIVNESVKGKTTFYYCVNDTQEERLIAGFENFQSITGFPGSTGKSKQMLVMLYNLITIALVRDLKDSLHTAVTDVNFCQYSTPVIKSFLTPVSPPPKFS
jgi:hypothetical protein